MSSHREAPEISQDPAADNADVYAFVSPDRPDTVTLISNFVPLQDPPGGPNFFEFGDDVQYSIYIDNDGDGAPEIAYVFNFTTRLRNPNTFLYNTGPITSLGSSNWNKRQFYSVTRVDGPDTTARRHFIPADFVPGANPFYVALPYDEVDDYHTKPEAALVIPWISRLMKNTK